VTTTAHKVAFYADLFYKSDLSPAYWIPPTDLDVEAVLLGGDIHYSPDLFSTMLKEIRATQRAATWIVMVPGNGEYIDQELNESRGQYRAAVESVPNAVFLDDGAIELPSGLRIIGSTLWSYVPDDEIAHYSQMLAGYVLKGVDNIRLGDRFLTLDDTNELHTHARQFIEHELRSLSKAQRDKTVVCTHFWPTLEPWTSTSGDAEGEWVKMTGSSLDAMIAECGPKFWLCGHAHETKRVTIGGTEVISNPRAGSGPGHVNPDFSGSLVVEL
jgi:Icc-related predicted phosphoesterase